MVIFQLLIFNAFNVACVSILEKNIYLCGKYKNGRGVVLCRTYPETDLLQTYAGSTGVTNFELLQIKCTLIS